MMLQKLVRAVIAPAVGAVLMLASTAQAADVAAAAFLAAHCPGPFQISTDTTLVGTATVTGSCTLGTAAGAIPGAEINLRNARLTFTGSFSILGNASSMTVEKSRITTTGNLVLDSHGLMTISESTLTAQGGGNINLPPRDSLVINRSKLVASGNLTVAGAGGLRDITDSDLSAGLAINIAPGSSSVSGVPTRINVLGSTLSAGSSLTVGGASTTQTISESALEAHGTGTTMVLSGSVVGARLISSTKISAPAGSIAFGGNGTLLVEDTKVSSGEAPGGSSIASIRVENGGGATSGTFVRTQFKSTLGTISFTGVGNQVFVDNKMFAGGVEVDGEGIRFGSGGGKSVIGTTIQAQAGDIRIVGSGDMVIMGSKLLAKGASGIHVGNGGARTLIDSQLDAPFGPISVIGSGDTQVVASALTAKNAGGILLSCGGSSEVNASDLVTFGLIRIPNGGGSTIAASTLRADLGFITETGVGGTGSNLFASQVKGSSVTVRSFGRTTVTDNKLTATTFEFSSTGVCTSTSNVPDIACF
jgi:hypothetical protein